MVFSYGIVCDGVGLSTLGRDCYHRGLMLKGMVRKEEGKMRGDRLRPILALANPHHLQVNKKGERDNSLYGRSYPSWQRSLRKELIISFSTRKASVENNIGSLYKYEAEVA